MARTLRKVLRGLVASRQKRPGLPSWKREHLLFICTYEWQRYRFAYFRAKSDDPRGARLSAFGWAPGTPNRTVCEFNLPALEWPDAPSDTEIWVKCWAAAFDKEPLTKDFFRRFDEALDAVKRDLEDYHKLSSAEAYSQAQLLLERLIFLYFLQNRGWLNRDAGYLPKKLQDYSDKPDAFTYYTEFLDLLFWTLASPPDSAGRLSGIPFLNGGLFDDDEFRQPGHLRKANPPFRVRNGTFQTVFGRLLEAFNFTVTEDTPLNQEVAVDPGMLGKVFESIVLHAEEAGPDAIAPGKRKATGSYYTPRIVVHFICREVLYQYLLSHLAADSVEGAWGPRLKELLALDASDGIDEEKRERLRRTLMPDKAVQVLKLVKPLRCCDPAVGSGAFPVGLMHELVNLRRLLETVANGYLDPVRKQGAEWLHSTKADIVQNCLFGVDIQQQAIEICRLRQWLSLVVDYDLGLDPFNADRSQFSRAIDRISQLPNLEVNFHRGDSLHDHISGVPVVILPGRASRLASEFQDIAKYGAKLHQAKSSETKKKLRLQILEKRLVVSQHILEEEMQALRTDDSALDTLFGLTISAVERRKRNQQELERLADALKKIERDRNELERLRNRLYDTQFYPKLRKLEGADSNSPFNFAWRLDFPSIFGANGGGFDIIVGNPPFVTARNPVKRELWRHRWPRVCVGTYQLVCPFFELAFSILASGSQLGFIVSNPFAKREFG
jgi:adenine-specific DNA-methyltransferase